MTKSSTPDLILHNGKIVTVDRDDTVVEAVAVTGNLIQALGSDSEIKALASDSTQMIDLSGNTLIPGLIDNHVHMGLAGMDLPEADIKVNILQRPSIEEILEAIRERVERTPPGEWVVTSCMYRGGLAEGRFPSRHDLDRVSTEHPLYIMQSGKNIIVNSKALEIAGITRDNAQDPPDPEGFYVRDDDGDLTGHLIAGAADEFRKRCLEMMGQRPIMWDFLIYPREDRKRSIRAMMKVYNQCGVTGCREMGVSPDEVEAYTELQQLGEMTVRVNLLLGLPARYMDLAEIRQAISSYFGPKQGFGNEWLRLGGLKMVMHNDGYWSLSREKMEAILFEANRLGWTMAIHVGSPEAADLILDLLEQANSERPLKGRRFTIEHRYQRFNKKAYQKFSEWGVIIASNPQLTYMAAGRAFKMHQAMAAVRLMKHEDESAWDRAVNWYGMPMRDWLDAGVTVTAGTDNPAVAYDPEQPLLGYYMAVTGDTQVGVLLPGQQLTRMEALKAYTINNAYATFEESIKGSIEPGKLADMAVLSHDPLTAPDEALPDTKVTMTIVDGKIVYER
jgi:predicted amidohydrolase YtcJ